MIIFHQNNEGDKKISLPQLIQKVILILWLSWTVNTLITKDNIILIIT